jgi:transcriptional regulator with XRE-family HTH domain
VSAYKKPKYELRKLDMLVELRKQAKVSQSQAASFFEMKNYGSIANWEAGISKPRVTRRPQFIIYLIDKLALRHNYQQFLTIWNEVMVEQWSWAPLTEAELRHAFPGHTSTAIALAPEQLAPLEHITDQAGELARLARLVSGQTAPTAEVLWALAPGDAPPKRLPNGITLHSLYLIVLPENVQQMPENAGKIA